MKKSKLPVIPPPPEEVPHDENAPQVNDDAKPLDNPHEIFQGLEEGEGEVGSDVVVVNDPVPGPPPKVVNPPKKPLSEKQLAHLARIREKSNAARRAKRDMKAAQKVKEAADFEAYRNQHAAPPQAPHPAPPPVYNLRSTSAEEYKGLSAEE